MLPEMLNETDEVVFGGAIEMQVGVMEFATFGAVPHDVILA